MADADGTDADGSVVPGAPALAGGGVPSELEGAVPVCVGAPALSVGVAVAPGTVLELGAVVLALGSGALEPAVEPDGLGTGESLPPVLGVLTPGVDAVGSLPLLVTSVFDPGAGLAASFELHALTLATQVAQRIALSQ